ncbi:SirA family protein [Magnetococcus marinus MC-1]|uniref:SirA family protein n=1 Tax=Magnetococcus marinus (strain ATCC BAA-1437 / JCM 17883 / MC-1) TaxID=156889 RepID=A0L5S2_MAGMM|nr:sulfurtransferase TusA family protein [Magnetococcus marinus]ABK43315.1 SirA family protein [Magnetococcus marinus MC-1]
MNQSDAQLDARGMTCPLPILKAKKMLNGLATGQVLAVMATDPGSVKDMDSFCQQTGHHLMSTEQQGEALLFYIRKA